MPDKCMLFKDNIRELSRDSRLTREVPFFSLGSREEDVIQMMQQGCKRGGGIAPAVMRGVRFLAVAVLCVVVASCATLKPDSPDEQKVKLVTERAAARWQAIIGKDFATAYEYLSPSSRTAVTPNGFRTVASRLDYRAAKVTGATCEGGTCRVKLMLSYNAAVATKGGETTPVNSINTPLEENWIIERGQLWYVWPL
jgi:hypothetical protein